MASQSTVAAAADEIRSCFIHFDNECEIQLKFERWQMIKCLLATDKIFRRFFRFLRAPLPIIKHAKIEHEIA